MTVFHNFDKTSGAWLLLLPGPDTLLCCGYKGQGISSLPSLSSRARQGLIPDFRMRLPDSGGLTDNLAEIKFIGAGAGCFPRGVAGRGKDRRDNGLPNLYKPLDARFQGTQAGQSGPLVRRLESFGVC